MDGSESGRVRRLSRYRREATPPPLVLQERDRRILAAVGQHRFLSREQIERLFFGTTTRTNFRLQKLFHHRYLNRLHLPTVKGSSQAIYSLDREGVPVAAEILGLLPTAIPWKYKQRDVKPLFMRHLLAINDVRVAFEVAARSSTDHELLLWLGEQEARDAYAWGYEHKTLAPDAYGRYRFGNRVVSFFLEVDQATMPMKRWREKAGRYIEYANSGRYEERYGMRLFRVVVVTTTPKRLVHLKTVAEDRNSALFWLATLSDLRAKGVLAEIWHRPGDPESRGLLSAQVAFLKGL